MLRYPNISVGNIENQVKIYLSRRIKVKNGFIKQLRIEKEKGNMVISLEMKEVSLIARARHISLYGCNYG